MSSTAGGSFWSELALVGRGFDIQRRVIGALIMRELHTRFGRDNIGYLWMVAEPTMLASVIALLHAAHGGATAYGNDMDPVTFTVIGYTVFIIFRGIFNRAEGSIEANQPLMYHRMVTIFDIMVSKAVIELAGCFITLCILLGFLMAIGYTHPPVRPLHLISGIMFMGWLSFAMALGVVAITYGNHTLGRLTHPISYFMIPLSGAFWQLDWIPLEYRGYMAYNPLVLIFEQARYGMFNSAKPDYIDPGYVAGVSAFLTYAGLIGIARTRRRLHIG